MSKILENIQETDDDNDYKSDFDREEEETNHIYSFLAILIHINQLTLCISVYPSIACRFGIK